MTLMGVLVALLSGCATTQSATAPTALLHFYQVDERVYRGGQPTEEGFKRLAAMGIKTIVSLRAHRLRDAARRREKDLVESLGMRWVSLPMRMYWRPSESQVRTFLALADDPDDAPVFVHCQHGEDRTGSLIAVYRVARQGWAPARAYAEARTLGLAGWNPYMRTLILRESPRYF